MGVSTFKRSSITLGKDGAGKDFKAFGATSGAYMRWNKATDTLELVNANFDVVGDIEIEGDVTLTTEDISLILTKHIYFNGQDATEYINSANAGYLDLEAATAIRPGIDLLTDRWQSSVTNTFIGMGVCGAGGLQAGGINNVGLGYQAFYSIATCKHSVAIGYQALYNDTEGRYNVAVGYQALYENEGQRNTAIGYQALKTFNSGTGAGWNTALGCSALDSLTTGLCNVALGARAGDVMTTGGNNVVIGYSAGDNITTADNCIIIGHGVDPASATVDAQIKIGGGTAAQGYILGDSAGDMQVNAVTGKTVELAVAGAAVATIAGALVTLAQITSVTDATEASAVGTASLKTAGGLGVAGKAYIGTELLLVAGPLDMSTVAEDIEIKADTIAALEIKGAANLLVFDTRIGITGVTAFLFTVPDIGFASASGSTRIGVSIDPGTLTFSDTQTVTAMEGLGLYISAHTFAGTAATVTDASTVYIASAPASGGSVTVTNGYALKIAAGDMITAGSVESTNTTAGFIISGAATDGISITGACTDGIDISGDCTNGINITATGMTMGLHYNVDMTAEIAANVEGIKIILERTADAVIGTSNILGAEFIIKQGSDAYAAGMAPQITGVRIAMGGANTKATVVGLKCETQSNGYVDYMGIFSINDGCTLASGGAVLYVRSYATAAKLVKVEQPAATTATDGIFLTDNVGTGTITNLITINARNSTNFIKWDYTAGCVAVNTHSIDAHALQGIITVDMNGDTGYIPIFAAVPS